MIGGGAVTGMLDDMLGISRAVASPTARAFLTTQARPPAYSIHLLNRPPIR